MRCNTRFTGVLLALSVPMIGCGEEGGFPPVLTDYDVLFVPDDQPRYAYGFNDGEVALYIVVSFEDPDGDVVSLNVTWKDCGREMYITDSGRTGRASASGRLCAKPPVRGGWLAGFVNIVE